MGYRRWEVVSPRRGFAGDEAEGGDGSGERVGRNREEVVWGAEWEERVPRVLLREREGRPGALQRARHRDGEVAAAGLGGGAWQSKERHSAMAKGRWGASVRRVEASAKQEVARRRPRAASGAALCSAAVRKTEGAGGRG